MIRSAKQLAIARAFLSEHQLTKDWLNHANIVGKNDLDYYKSRNFLLKLIRNGYVHTRRLDSKKAPLDFRFSPEGYSRLMQEYMDLMSRNGN
jgi:hypothetical protein